MVDLAKKYFGFNDGEDSVIESIIADAYEFLPKQAAQSYDAVFIDVNFEEGL
jgi:spermidine synthase